MAQYGALNQIQLLKPLNVFATMLELLAYASMISGMKQLADFLKRI